MRKQQAYEELKIQIAHLYVQILSNIETLQRSAEHLALYKGASAIAEQEYRNRRTTIDAVAQTKVQAGRNIYGCYLEFDLNNPLHQFDKGLVEKNQIVLNVRWELKPTEWNDYVGFGSYSDAKYMFIMDVCQRVWDDLEDEDIDVIKQAYREYKEEGNPPILGEEGDEIEYE